MQCKFKLTPYPCFFFYCQFPLRRSMFSLVWTISSVASSVIGDHFNGKSLVTLTFLNLQSQQDTSNNYQSISSVLTEILKFDQVSDLCLNRSLEDILVIIMLKSFYFPFVFYLSSISVLDWCGLWIVKSFNSSILRDAVFEKTASLSQYSCFKKSPRLLYPSFLMVSPQAVNFSQVLF